MEFALTSKAEDCKAALLSDGHLPVGKGLHKHFVILGADMESIDFEVQLVSINHFGDGVGKVLEKTTKLMDNIFMKKSRSQTFTTYGFRALMGVFIFR